VSLFANTDHRAPADRSSPLADRMRPRTVSEVVGQEHLLGTGRALHQIITRGIGVSLLFWGPPGSGKTTLARLIATEMNAVFVEYSAVLSGVKQIREVIEQARRIKKMDGRQTLLFIDEIHRFNKIQQDAFLPHVETGTIVLIGATTENPSFEVIPALLSRCRIFTLKPLSGDSLKLIIQSALTDTERGLGLSGKNLDTAASGMIVDYSGGDARVALNTLEFAARLCREDPEAAGIINRKHVEEALQTRPASYDKAGEQHFNLISAFHKSIRGSDPDAALYWMCRMLDGGEDPLYLARRMIRIASEDIGLADPNALQVTIAAREAFRVMGSPEGELALAEAAIYLATAPKSNSAETAMKEAKRTAEITNTLPVPLHLRNAPTAVMKREGYGRNYQYDHDMPGAYAGQDFLPEEVQGKQFYNPKEFGFEREITRRLSWWRNRKREIKKNS
jgi:putative ATPase